MPRGKLFEPKLCPSCRLKSFIPKVKYRSYTRTPSLETNVKLCSKLRHYSKLFGLDACPHFPKSEVLNGWLGKQKRRRKRR